LILGLAVDFDLSLSAGASLNFVREGDLVNGIGTLLSWPNSNKNFEYGDDKVAGYPIVNVDPLSKYFDVVNPNGIAMPSTLIGAGSEIIISSSPIIEWRFDHSSYLEIESISVTSGIATVTTKGPHLLNSGDTFTLIDNQPATEPTIPGAGTGTVVDILLPNQFRYAAAGPDATISPGGFLSKTGKVRTRYKIDDLGYNNTFRLSRYDGDSPRFTSLGAAVDDLLILSGETFNPINSGYFRILAIDEDSIIYQNSNGKQELDTIIGFNNFDSAVIWTANLNQITGSAGSFRNLNIGDWVKKVTDDDTKYVQVSGFDTGLASTATIVTLANNYSGTSSVTAGHALDQNSSIGTGIYLKDTRDIRIIEGDSVRVNDSIFINENTSNTWFSSTNSGTFIIDNIGTDATDGKVFLRVNNPIGIAQSGVRMDVSNTRFIITESDDNKFTSIKQIAHVAIDELNEERRVLYLTPGDRDYKWNQTNSSGIVPVGKIGYSEDITTGVDGYLYYTGLLRKVQRIVDGFEPDQISFPGRKAVGSLIEVLPPLPRRVKITIDVTTEDGVNLSEISDEITSVVINYISDLGVGEDVILSDVIVRVKNIEGVSAVTFVEPSCDEERVSISSDEKAFSEVSDISIA
jgi:hypothetical protein